jgi:hypothetical protein
MPALPRRGEWLGVNLALTRNPRAKESADSAGHLDHKIPTRTLTAVWVGFGWWIRAG